MSSSSSASSQEYFSAEESIRFTASSNESSQDSMMSDLLGLEPYRFEPLSSPSVSGSSSSSIVEWRKLGQLISERSCRHNQLVPVWTMPGYGKWKRLRVLYLLSPAGIFKMCLDQHEIRNLRVDWSDLKSEHNVWTPGSSRKYTSFKRDGFIRNCY